MPDVRFALFCEDLRTELSGQVTAVGIWGGRVHVQAFPTVLRSMAYFASVANPERQPYPFRFTLEGPFDPAMQAIAHEGVCATDPEYVGQNFNLIIAPVALMEPGTIRARLRIESNPPVEQVTELMVVHGEAGPPRPIVTRAIPEGPRG